MRIRFSKYHGTGNDFILIDGRREKILLSTSRIENLCNRHLGIGADGLMILTPASGFDFGMTYYNADGKESSMCGNGGRCIIAFARELGIIMHTARFMAADGEHTGVILDHQDTVWQVRIRLSDVPAIDHYSLGTFLNTGSPHLIVFRNHIKDMDVISEGRKLRYDQQFAPEGLNVDFVEVTHSNLNVRTYERGVENETLSCGTGVTAAAIASVYSGMYPSIPTKENCIQVKTLGGSLLVRFSLSDQIARDVFLEGAATFVFQGEVSV